MKKIICELPICMALCLFISNTAFAQQQNGVKIHQEKNKKTTAPVNDKNAKPIAAVKEQSVLQTEAKKFCDFFKTYEEPSQFYTVPANEIKDITGKEGTVISVNPDDLTTLTNQSVDKAIEVELKELVSQQQLLKTNAQTMCNGKQLVSGGAYYINLKSDGQPVKLKPGKSLSVKFPKFTEEPMGLFSGYRDSLGQMQWKQRNQTFKKGGPTDAWRDTRNVRIESEGDVLQFDTIAKRKPKQETKAEVQKKEAYDKLYTAMDIQNLGWINCDRFYNVTDKTTVSIKISNTTPVSFVSIYLIFDAINSIVQTHYGAVQKEVSNPGFENIPVGAKARLVAFSLKGDKMMAYEAPVTVKKDDIFTIFLKEVSEEELRTLLEKK
ncbi:MAG TPA: hypothetical protein PLL00_11475 [Bacteroidia bacterium]|nr:hypothetical protein [Bacteroidia bacterium]